MERHIFISGFMGAGKSTLGKGLAAILNYRFCDLDDYVEEKEGQTIQQIFDSEGETAFREIETTRLTEIIASSPPAVIALGGGTVCNPQNLRMIKDNGFLVFLKLPETVLFERLEKETATRPLLRGLRGDSLRLRIHELLEERQKYYREAHLVVDAQYLTPQLLYREISAPYEFMFS